jgi:hypothetical protein
MKIQRRYIVSIESNTDSTTLTWFDTKKEAVQWASYYRSRPPVDYPAIDDPKIRVYDNKKAQEIYCKGVFKYALP